MTPEGKDRPAGSGAGSMEALYPFLYADTGDLSAVLEQVRASTVAKAGEIVELRRVISARDGARLAECARQAAARFAALCNDIGVDVVFARQLAAFGGRHDIAIGLSTSGNSANLLRAFDEASRRGMLTIGLAGYSGGQMAELDSIDYLFVVPSSSIHRIQEAQTTIYQVFWELTSTALSKTSGAGAVGSTQEVSHVSGHTG